MTIHPLTRRSRSDAYALVFARTKNPKPHDLTSSAFPIFGGSGEKRKLAIRAGKDNLFRMSTVEKIASELTRMRPEEQAEVLDFVEFLKRKSSIREERAFNDFSLANAMRGMEDEPDLYSEEDIREPVR